MIDLSRVRDVLTEINDLVDQLDGLDLDETNALTSQSKGKARTERAQRSQELQMLATRFELAGSLVRVEYWAARGAKDPLNPDRDGGGDG